MKLDSIESAIKDYERITKEPVECDEKSAVKILPTNEFMIWRLGVYENTPYFYIDQTYAKNFSNFVPFIKEVCKAAGIKTIVTATQRPKAHYRKWKMELLKEYDFDGRHYYLLKGDIKNLK